MASLQASQRKPVPPIGSPVMASRASSMLTGTNSTIVSMEGGHGDALLPSAPAVGYVELGMWCLTGMSGWWSLNVITAELPLLIAELPEGSKMGNLIAVCTQLGNVAPIMYKTCFLREGSKRHVTRVIGGFHALATAVLMVLAFFWNFQVYGYSLVLLCCTVLAGSAGCMSSVTYWAVTLSRPEACTKALSVGMVLGGLVAICWSSCQIGGRSKGSYRFPASVYFIMAAVVQMLQGIVFSIQSRKAGSRDLSEAVSSRESAPESGGPHGEELEEAAAERMPRLAHLFCFICFLIYGATYTMPSLLPYMAKGYTDDQQLLLLMQLLQNIGDVSGRLATSCSVFRVGWFGLAVSGIALITGFGASIMFVIERNIVPFGYAAIAFPGTCAAFYFSRGLLVTALQLRARNFGDASSVQKLSMNMGFSGQMGALVANIIAFSVVTVFRVLD